MTGTRKHYNDGFEGPPLEAGISWFDPASAGSPDAREYLLLASYCGADDPDCTEQRPCSHCLAMSNVFIFKDGEPAFVREFGDLSHTPTTNAPVADREAIARVLASFDHNCSVPEYNKEMIDKWWPRYLSKVDLILAALRQTLPIHGEMREALEQAETGLAAVIRLSEMGFEQSMMEPEENGNYVGFNLAKSALACVRAALSRNALQGDGL